MRKSIKIIFLDIDGVLNGYNFITEIFYFLWKHTFIFKNKFKMLADISGIHERKIKLLSKICNKTNAKIVISSSWKNILVDDNGNMINTNKNARIFWGYINKYNIDVIGKTPNITNFRNSSREDEIIAWLSRR